MDYIPYLILGAVGAAFVVANQFNTVRAVGAAIKKEQKIQVLEALFKQFGIKDFKLKDLNANVLDDKGFARLITMLQTVYSLQGQAQGAGGDMQAFSKALAEIKALAGTMPSAQGTQGTGIP